MTETFGSCFGLLSANSLFVVLSLLGVADWLSFSLQPRWWRYYDRAATIMDRNSFRC